MVANRSRLLRGSHSTYDSRWLKSCQAESLSMLIKFQIESVNFQVGLGKISRKRFHWGLFSSLLAVAKVFFLHEIFSLCNQKLASVVH